MWRTQFSLPSIYSPLNYEIVKIKSFLHFKYLTPNLFFTVRNVWNAIFLNPSKPPLLSYRTGPLHLNTHFISPQSVPLEAILVPTRRGSTFWPIWNSNKAAAAAKKRKHADGNLLEMLKLSLGKHSTWHTGIHFTLAGWLWRGGAFVALTPSAHLHCMLQLFQIFWNTKLYAMLGCKITVYLGKKKSINTSWR